MWLYLLVSSSRGFRATLPLAREYPTSLIIHTCVHTSVNYTNQPHCYCPPERRQCNQGWAVHPAVLAKNLSNSPLNFSTVHPFRSLMFLRSELNSFTDCTKRLSSLIVFSRVDAVRLKRGSLKERPFLPPLLLSRSIHFSTRSSNIFQRYIIRYVSSSFQWVQF